MHILLIGDVVGNSGCCFLQERLPQLKRTHHVDLTIVNGENSAQGNGITKHSMEQLFSAGADIITTGNHCFQRREALSIYEKETILRPLNFPDSCPGHGCTIWDNGPYQVAVINLMGTAYMDPLDNPFTVIEEFLPTLPTKNITQRQPQRKRQWGIFSPERFPLSSARTPMYRPQTKPS